MTIDISKFTASKAPVLNYFNGAAGRDVRRTISMAPQITGVPCIVVAFWLGEHQGWSEEILAAIVRLKSFYGYTEIIGKPEGCPSEI